MASTTAARVEARLNELKAENAKLRGFVEAVAGRTTHDTFWTRIAQDLLAEIDLLAAIDKRL